MVDLWKASRRTDSGSRPDAASRSQEDAARSPQGRDETNPRGDEPRLIVVCSPAEFMEINRGVMDMGYGDVLVRSDRYVPEGYSYVMKPSGEAIGRFTPWVRP